MIKFMGDMPKKEITLKVTRQEAEIIFMVVLDAKWKWTEKMERLQRVAFTKKKKELLHTYEQARENSSDLCRKIGNQLTDFDSRPEKVYVLPVRVAKIRRVSERL